MHQGAFEHARSPVNKMVAHWYIQQGQTEQKYKQPFKLKHQFIATAEILSSKLFAVKAEN